MKLDILNKELQEDKLEEIKDLLSRAITESRNLSHLLRPSILDELGLAPAIEELIDNFGEAEGIEFASSLNLSAEIKKEEKKAILYRAVQELLNNAVKHADPEKIEVVMTSNDSLVRLSVEDDGKGFNPEEVAKESGLGLRGIKENVAIAGGKFELSSAEGEGTRAQIELPLD